MWKCPICKTNNKENKTCKKCGFDNSSNYLYYKTVARLPDEVLEKYAKYNEGECAVILAENDVDRGLGKVRCLYCDNEWYVAKEKKEQVKVCPFCKKEIVLGGIFRKLERLLIEEEGVSVNMAESLVKSFKDIVINTKEKVMPDNQRLMKNPESSIEKLEKNVCFTYSECSKQKGLSWNASKTWEIPEGYTHVMRGGLSPIKDEVEELKIPKSVRYIDLEELRGCKLLKKIILDPQNQHFKMINGALYSMITKTKIWAAQ